jgi:hypothetical protein
MARPEREASMQAYIDALNKRYEILCKTISQARAKCKNAPEGYLHISAGKKQINWYRVSAESPGRHVYIPQKDIDLAKALASKTYVQKFILRASRELRSLEEYLRRVTGKTPEDLYSEMSVHRRKLVQPLLVTDEISAALWESTAYVHGTSFPEHKIYPTKKGDLVRSKSEAFIADTYYEMGIPYRYEQVIVFPDGSELDPDFTVWDKKNRKEIYHEHCGLMDDPGYRRRFLQKIDIYRKHGIYTGRNLILTFEGEGIALNMREVRTMLGELFL